MTSNIGSRQLKDFGQGVGFATAAKTAANADHAKSILENALKKSFAPEFLNRIDDVVIFENLEKEDIHKIIDIELSYLYDRIRSMGYQITVSDKAKDFICEKGWDAQFGARPLKRAIQKYIEDALAEEMMRVRINIGDVIQIDIDDTSGEIKIAISKKSAEPKEVTRSN